MRKEKNKTDVEKRNTVVLYHKDCTDGFAAAWAAWKKFGDEALYYPVTPHQLPQVSIRDADVFVCDSSLSLSALKKLRAQNCIITVLDHHVSSEQDVKSADMFVFDIKHSGAMITWNYFFPRAKAPRLIQYVEDGDLWNFRFKDTDYISNILRLEGFDFKKWNAFSKKLEQPKSRKKIILNGKIIERYRNELVAESVKRASLVLFEGYTVYAVNEATEAIRSEVAHVLFAKRPPFSVVWSQDGNALRISLRSKKDGFDVSLIAKKYGGGGHAQAAGFLLSAGAPLPWKPMLSNKLRK